MRLSKIYLSLVFALVFTPLVFSQTKSDVFTLVADGRELFVEQFKGYHYVDFDACGTVDIVVKFNGIVDSCTLSPISKGISTTIKGDNINFVLPAQGWYILEVSGNQLIILVNEMEKSRPDVKDTEKVVSVTEFTKGANGLLTEQLQRAIDIASAQGKTLYFPAGVYKTGTLTIGSNSNIYLERGALIKGSENREDYPTDNNLKEADHINNKAEYSDNGEFMTFSRLILIEGDNVHIWGRGTIDGSGTMVRAQGKPANLIRVRNSKNVLVEGIIQRDPAAWNTHIIHSEDVTFRAVKLLNDFNVANTDGFDPDASKNILIERCFAYCNDDNIAIKTTNNLNMLQNLEDVTVRGCVFYTRKSSLKVGTETKGALMRNILFEDNDVVGCDRALALYCNDGALFDNIAWVNNRIEKNVRDSQRRAIMFKIGNRYGKGNIRNLLIKDCIFYTHFPNGSSIDGLDEQHTIENIIFDNVTIQGKKMTSITDFGIKKTSFVKNIVVR